MIAKLLNFIGSILFALFIAAIVLVIGGIFATSMNVTCEFQRQDEAYNCVAHDTILNYQLTQKQADSVWKLEEATRCSGSGKNRGCSYIVNFVTLRGERIQLSRLFTANESGSEKLTQEINSLMQSRTPVIEYNSGLSYTFYFIAGLAGFMFLMFSLSAFARLFLPDNGGRGIVIDLSRR